MRSKKTSKNTPELALNYPISENKITVAIDAEWDSRTKRPLLVQFKTDTKKDESQILLYGAPELLPPDFDILSYCSSRGASYFEPETELGYSNILLDVLRRVGFERGNVNLLMFYSPKDLEYALGWPTVKTSYDEKKITQDTVLRTSKTLKLGEGGEYSVTVHDLSGWTDKGLKALAESVGINMENKDKLDDYKHRMADAFREHPELALDYAIDDVKVLLEADEKFRDLTNQVFKLLKLKPPEELPHTIGALVARAFETFVNTRSSDNYRLALAICKLGILETRKQGKKKKNLPAIRRQVIDAARKGLDITDSDYREFTNIYNYADVAYSQCSVKYLAGLRDSRAFNAVIHGGRCANEAPKRASADLVADIDWKSCYGTALTDFNYPLGLPRAIGVNPNEETITLKEFFNIYGEDLVPGLWQVTVSGTLRFDQDLIFSRDTTIQKISKAVKYDLKNTNTEVKHIEGDFVLLRREIVNGIITQDIWEDLKKIATSQELKELNELKVVTASWYSAAQQCDTVEDWVETVLEDTGEIRTVQGTMAGVSDDRTRAWVSLPIKDFIGPLVEERNKLKENPEQKPLCNTYKLFINTLYGVLSSPYFRISNTVVTNNITARARLETWKLKALRNLNSITDGGLYELNGVAFHGDKKAGLELLSDMESWYIKGDKNNKGRSIGPLGGVDWQARLETIKTEEDLIALGKELDSLATDHLNEFWGAYGVPLRLTVEHKPLHTSWRAAYYGKGDYALRPLLEDVTLYRIRSARKFDGPGDVGKVRHPKYTILDTLLNGEDTVYLESLEYDHTSIMKVDKYLQVQSSAGYENLKNHRPGDEIHETRTAHFNNTHFPAKTLREYLARQDRKTSRKVEGEKVNIQLFEKFLLEGGLSKMMLRMGLNSL